MASDGEQTSGQAAEDCAATGAVSAANAAMDGRAGIPACDAPMERRGAVSSTNDVAIDAAYEGAPHGWAVSAQSQTAGRGRRGHAWTSPEGSLYLSIVLRPGVPMQNLIAVPAVSAMGVMDALHGLGLAGRVGIKWPNDIVACADAAGAADDAAARAGSRPAPQAFDRKLAGILTEARAGEDGPFVVVGMGVNVHPVQVDAGGQADGDAPTSPQPLDPISLVELMGESAEPPALDDLARTLRDAVVARVDAWADAVRASRGVPGPLAPILSEYFDMVPMLGHQVAVLSPTGHLMNTGVFAGLDVWGRACVMTPQGEQTYPSEAVSLRAL